MSDESVLQQPGEHSVEEVVSALASASPEDVDAVKARESEGKRRKGILEYEHPVEAEPEPVDQERYDLNGWRERARGWLDVSPHAVSGALHGEEGPWTQAEVEQRLRVFLKPPEEPKS